MRRRTLELVLVLAAVAVMVRLYFPAPSPAPTSLMLEGEALTVLSWQPDQPELMNYCAKSLSLHTGVKAIPKAMAGPDERLKDKQRGQYDAHQLVRQLEQGQTNPPVLLVVEEDLYTTGRPEWRYCYGERGRRAAVLSCQRLDFRTRVGADRLDKMLARYATQVCGKFRPSGEPTSLFYQNILGPGDIDRMMWPQDSVLPR